MRRIFVVVAAAIILALQLPGQVVAPHSRPRVAVIAKPAEGDVVGAEVSFQIRQTVGASPLFDFVQSGSMPKDWGAGSSDWVLLIFTLDPHQGDRLAGQMTVFSYEILKRADSCTSYKSSGIMVAGEGKVGQVATQVAAELDKTISQ